MTLDELRQLPSRERDALVAERVMGWQRLSPSDWLTPKGATELPVFTTDWWIIPLMERMRLMRFVPNVGRPDWTFRNPLNVALKYFGDKWECGWEVVQCFDAQWADIFRNGQPIELMASAPTAGESVVLAALLGSYYAEKA